MSVRAAAGAERNPKVLPVRHRGARLWIRELDGSMAIPMPGTDGATFPFWSADGTHIGFFAGGMLKSVASRTFELRSIGTTVATSCLRRMLGRP
jgi:hypothetical protein